MRNCNNIIKTVGVGKIMSAGPLLLSAGDKGHRTMYEHARIMLHRGGAEMEGTKADIEVEMEEATTLDDMWYKAMAKQTKKRADYWREVCSKNLDHNIGAIEAKKLGIVDEIIKP